MKIAISGPAASGKGTIARRLATEATLGYVDLGLVFRLGAFALKTRRVNDLVDLLRLVQDGRVAYIWTGNKAMIIWGGEDITNLLLTQEVAHKTSVLASDELQQEKLTKIANHILAAFEDVVCDGRNAGTTILPDADYKFFVTASLEERARRRYLDLLRLGENVSYEDVLGQVRERDRRDAERSSNPLIVPSGAIVLETDARSVDESVRFILEVIKGSQP
jgi:cytidylate kinase